jgi:replicative DNA helicase
MKPTPRTPPHSIELEQALLGGLLLHNAACWEVADLVSAKDFFEPLHGRIFTAIGCAIGASRVASVLTLQEAFEAEPPIGPLSVGDYLGRLAANATSLRSIPDYARGIRRYRIRRELLALGETLSEEAATLPPETEAQHLIEAAEKTLAKLAAPSRAADVVSACDAVACALRKDADQSIPFGLGTLDEHTGGARRGEFVVIAGRPSMGKSVVGMNIAARQAEAGFGVHFISLEMNEKTVGSRLVADRYWSEERSIPFSAILGDRLTDEQGAALAVVGAAFERLPLTIDTGAGQTMHEVRNQVRRLKRERERNGQTLDVVIIDYLGLIRSEGRYLGNKVAETEEISAALKALAKDLDVAVIALVQLSRQTEGRPDNRPMLSDLRWSGAIEQDADVVILLFRPAYYLERKSEDDPDLDLALREKIERKKNDLELIIAKQRNGACRTIRVFVDLASAAVRDRKLP